MWGKNNSNSQNQGPRQNQFRQNERTDSRQHDFSQNYSQNYVQNPFNSDLDTERNSFSGGRADRFNAGESRDDQRADYNSNHHPTYGRSESDYSTRSGTAVGNRQGQTGSSTFNTQYGLNYGSEKSNFRNDGRQEQGSRYGTDYGTAYGDRDQNWGERSDYGSEHVDLESGSDRDRWSQIGLNGRGQHVGKGPKNYRRSDERIQEEVNERLTHDAHIDATHIDVHVSEGVITLSGTVDERRSKRMAEDCIDNVSGVIDIKNDIRVQGRQDRSALNQPAADPGNEGYQTRDTLTSMKAASKPGKGLM